MSPIPLLATEYLHCLPDPIHPWHPIHPWCPWWPPTPQPPRSLLMPPYVTYTPSGTWVPTLPASPPNTPQHLLHPLTLTPCNGPKTPIPSRSPQIPPYVTSTLLAPEYLHSLPAPIHPNTPTPLMPLMVPNSPTPLGAPNAPDTTYTPSGF